MLTMINKSQIIEISTEELDFYNALTNEVCYGFPIKEGKNKPTPTKRNSSGKYISCKKNECTWWKNYELCLEMEKLGQLYSKRERYVSTVSEPAKVKCRCGQKFFLTNDYLGACSCPKCGSWYNLFGQELRRDWTDEIDHDDEWW